MKTTLTLILLVLTTGIYAETSINIAKAEPDFQLLLSGLPNGEGRYIVEEGFSSDADNPDTYTTTWIAGYDCVENGKLWSINAPFPRAYKDNDHFVNSNMTINYYMCPNIDIDVEHGKTIDHDNCEKIASYNVGIGFVVENKKINIVYTPNKLNVDASSVASHYPACTPKAQNDVMQNLRTNPHNMKS